MYYRSIHVADVMEGKLFSSRVVMVRFVEAEASVSVILEKLKVAMGDDDNYVLTDTLGNEIVESEGTTGEYIFFKFNFHLCQMHTTYCINANGLKVVAVQQCLLLLNSLFVSLLCISLMKGLCTGGRMPEKSTLLRVLHTGNGVVDDQVAGIV